MSGKTHNSTRGNFSTVGEGVAESVGVGVSLGCRVVVTVTEGVGVSVGRSVYVGEMVAVCVGEGEISIMGVSVGGVGPL